MPTNLLDPHSLDFSDFTGRNEALAKLYRYKIYKDAWYRSNLIDHSHRVLALFQATIPRIIEVFPDIDIRRIEIMCLVHDDAEIFTGDFPSVLSTKMNQTELADIDNEEELAISHIETIFPKTFAGYDYPKMLRDILHKKDIEAQIVKFFDHLDALGEALHEIYAGNPCFVTPPQTDYGLVAIPPDYHISRFANPEKNYSLLLPIIDGTMPFVRAFERIDFESIVPTRTPHTAKNILEKTGYPFYDWWKETLWQNGNPSIRRYLTEFSKRKIY